MGYSQLTGQKSTKELLNLSPGPGGMTPNETARMDRKGVPINKRTVLKDRKNKMAHKLTFADQLESQDKAPLATTIYVESYKQHNVMANDQNQGCCTLF
jgi:hypothetical protein